MAKEGDFSILMCISLLGVAARRIVDHGYSVEWVADQYLKLYQELLDAAGH